MKEIKQIQYIENLRDERSYIAAKVLINISATLQGIKPATLLNFSKRRGKNLIHLWDMHKHSIVWGQNMEWIELKRDEDNLFVLFYHRRNLIKQIFAGKHMGFLKRFGYSQTMSIQELLNHLKDRYINSCPHEIGLFLGIPLKDVLGYLKLISLECTYCGYWKVYGNCEKTKRLFQRYREAKRIVIDLISSGEDPIKILRDPANYKSWGKLRCS